MINQSELLVKLDNAGVYKSSKWLVQGVSLEISKGQIVTLIGPNGSGKTTTAKMVLNILNTDKGSILRNTKKLAYVPQKIDIDWALGKQKTEPATHKKLFDGKYIGDLSGASSLVKNKSN